jgi:Condensation domain/Alcohol acetyltransferase
MQRPLGSGEHLFWLSDRFAPSHFCVTAKVLGKIRIEKLQQALVWIQQRHPLLRVSIATDTNEQPWFMENSASIPLRIVERLGEEHWQQEVENELSDPFNWNQAPLVRVVLVRSHDISEIIVICHHAIADGKSSVYLLRDILEAMGTPNFEGKVLPEYPAFEDLIPNSELPVISQESNNEAVKFDFPEIETNPNRRLRLLAWSLSSEKTTSLISRCRQEKTSVHSAICAAFLMAVYQQKQTQDISILKCLSPINLRKYLSPPIEEDCGYYFSMGLTSHTLSKEINFWDLARSLKSQLNQHMSPEQIFANIPQNQALISMNPNPELVQNILYQTYGYDVIVSNLTRLNIESEYGELELVGIYGPSASSRIQNERFIGVATLKDTMFFNFVYFEPEILTSDAVQLQQTAMELLTQITVLV